MSLRVSTYVDIKTLVFRHGCFAGMPSHMIFSNMSGVITIFFQSFRNGHRITGHILSLAWTCELSLLLGDARLLVSVQVSNNVDPIIDSGGILTCEHCSP